MTNKNNTEELSDDMEVVGPGQMLAQAREKAGLTQKDVAERLNFRTTLVKELEQDIFDKSLPATFNRGYLKNYAKLVDLPVDDVLASYEMICVAEMQGAEMQSFSKQTEKQAENNRLMWVTYLIVALLIGSTLMWWLQENAKEQDNASTNASQVESLPTKTNDDSQTSVEGNAELSENPAAEQKAEQAIEPTVSDVNENLGEESSTQSLSIDANQDTTQPTSVGRQALDQSNQQANPDANVSDTEISAADSVDVSFTFSGDCWVNIYDATGERIAWGIKKSGYEMNIQGIPPFNITLGKPELVTIVYNGEAVDTSSFAKGNIAKFNLPMTEE
ncbi:RodZ domain-containing protein [Thalassotalea ganghwensis]